MKHCKPLALFLSLLLLFGSAVALTATAKPLPTTVPVITETVSGEAQEPAQTEHSTRRQVLILLAFAAGVGVLAALYGVISMRYNKEKMDDMTEESRRRVKEMQEKNGHRS